MPDIEIYQLTSKGEAMAHNIYAPNLPGWKVIQYLSKRNQATKDQILQNIPDADGFVLRRLKRKGVIASVGRRVVL